ncbi:MAG: hypothetical protein F6J94_15115 [Moorea sp. SIO1F2]|nr:hypothetical protein [Moorena sp. SIO1F2]NET83207.1 hypothetical protein [Moorena sp. SIO1F2]
MERAPITAGVMAAWDVPGHTTWGYYLGILADYLIAASRYVCASSPCLDL